MTKCRNKLVKRLLLSVCFLRRELHYLLYNIHRNFSLIKRTHNGFFLSVEYKHDSYIKHFTVMCGIYQTLLSLSDWPRKNVCGLMKYLSFDRCKVKNRQPVSFVIKVQPWFARTTDLSNKFAQGLQVWPNDGLLFTMKGLLPYSPT
jgi:hypothetical protein